MATATRGDAPKYARVARRATTTNDNDVLQWLQKCELNIDWARTEPQAPDECDYYADMEETDKIARLDH